MGEKRTKLAGWRLSVLAILIVFACVLMSFGFGLLNVYNDSNRNLKKIAPQTEGEIIDEEPEEELCWVDIRQNINSSGGTTYYISTAGQLAYFNWMLTDAGSTGEGGPVGYSDCTFVLNNDIKLDDIDNKGTTPLWTPIEIGKNAKNRNITFDGNNRTISGMHIKYTDDETPRNVGFFAELYGGVVKNLTFKNPVIEYEYHGDSLEASDAPVEIGVGVVAGVADSTYIENVTIENPTITVTTENSNGHNFYVGGAVGKMSLTLNYEDVDGEKTRKSINTVTPTQWGINTVNVIKTDDDSTDVNLEINAGTENNVTYGKATNGYLGGLVGVNVSSKIVNSTLKGCAVNPQFTPKEDEAILAGNYFVGGLCGLSTQIIPNRDFVVASGLYNNLLLNVDLGDIRTVTEDSYCGNLVGRVYSGGWVYNNMIIGTMPYSDLWGQVNNAVVHYTSINDGEQCIGDIVGGVQDYYLDSENVTYPDCALANGAHDPDEDNGSTEDIENFTYCARHQAGIRSLITAGDKTATVETMRKFNYVFETTASDEFQEFLSEKTTVAEAGGIQIDNFERMTYFKYEEGNLFHVIKPILKYEIGLTINEKNSQGEDASAYEKSVDAIYQFRNWEYDDENKVPVIGDYTGLDYTVIFDANSQADSRAYWTLNNESELESGRTYQIIYDPDPNHEYLVCEGYKFLGWKIDGLTEGPLWNSYLENGYINGEGYYQFGKEEITTPGRRFLAQWERQKFTVTFVVREKGKPDQELSTANVYYGRPVDKPTNVPVSEQGYKFVGWFLEEDLPNDDQDADESLAWKFGSEGKLMPGENITLYSGWINNFTMLSSLLDDVDYASYYEKYAVYFEDESGKKFHDAYDAALKARQNNDTSNTENLLKNLENSFEELRVDPQKLLKLPAFDDSKIENFCPFLYKDSARMMYLTFKETVRKYINSSETDRTNIEAYIANYNRLITLFDDLKNNLTNSVSLEKGGAGSDRVKNIVASYMNLQNKNASLDESKYSNESLAVLEEAQIALNKLWNAESGDPILEDIDLALTACQNAFDNLQPATADNAGNTNTDISEESTGAVPQLPISPLLLGVIIVVVLMLGVGGYIGFDIMKNKNLLLKNKKIVNQYNEEVEEDEEGYF